MTQKNIFKRICIKFNMFMCIWIKFHKFSNEDLKKIKLKPQTTLKSINLPKSFKFINLTLKSQMKINLWPSLPPPPQLLPLPPQFYPLATLTSIVNLDYATITSTVAMSSTIIVSKSLTVESQCYNLIVFREEERKHGVTSEFLLQNNLFFFFTPKFQLFMFRLNCFVSSWIGVSRNPVIYVFI